MSAFDLDQLSAVGNECLAEVDMLYDPNDSEEWSLEYARDAIRARGYFGELPQWLEQTGLCGEEEKNVQRCLRMLYFFINRLDRVKAHDYPKEESAKARQNIGIQLEENNQNIDFQTYVDRLEHDREQLLQANSRLLEKIKKTKQKCKMLQYRVQASELDHDRESKQNSIKQDTLKRRVTELEQQISNYSHLLRKEKYEKEMLIRKCQARLLKTGYKGGDTEMDFGELD